MEALEDRRDHQLLSSVMHFPHSLTHSAPSTLCTRPPLFLNQQEYPVSPPLPTTNRRGGPADEQGAVLPITPATERERGREALVCLLTLFPSLPPHSHHSNPSLPRQRQQQRVFRRPREIRRVRGRAEHFTTCHACSLAHFMVHHGSRF